MLSRPEWATDLPFQRRAELIYTDLYCTSKHHMPTYSASSRQEEQSDDPVKAQFVEWDKDGDGFIGASDMKELMRTTMGVELDDMEVEELIREADFDGDGKLSLAEFTGMMTFM